MDDQDINYCPRCTAGLIFDQKFGRLRKTCPQCGWIYFTDPKVAAALLVFQEGKVLLARRANEPHRGEWTLPAGFVDAGEDPAQAALRECREETGLDVQLTGLLDVIAGQEHPRGAHILIVYQGKVVGGAMVAGDDVDQVGFFNLDDLPPLAFASTNKILSDGVKLFRQ